MAVKPCSLQIDIRQHETENRGTPMFPCGGYSVAVGGAVTENIPWHWHEEIEVIAVVRGSLKLDVPGRFVILHEGDAAFVGSSVLHMAVNADDSVCGLESFVFDPQLVFGSPESAIAQRYVRPLLDCAQLGVIAFQKGLAWHTEAIRCITEAFAHYQREEFGYELLVRDCLSRLWFLIVSNLRGELKQNQSSNNMETMRVKEMLGYIHAHYAEPMELKDIAHAAAVSERECLRRFHKTLGTTPMKYSLNYRISVAARLLVNSDKSITEICRLSGFESPSYFSLKFKELTDITPREYRRRESC